MKNFEQHKLVRKKYKAYEIASLPFSAKTIDALNSLKIYKTEDGNYSSMKKVEELMSYTEDRLTSLLYQVSPLEAGNIVKNIKEVLAIHGLRLKESSFTIFDIDINYLLDAMKDKLVVSRFIKHNPRSNTIGDFAITDKTRLRRIYGATKEDLTELAKALKKFGIRFSSPEITLDESAIEALDDVLFAKASRKRPVAAVLENEAPKTKPETESQNKPESSMDKLKVIEKYLALPLEESDLPEYYIKRFKLKAPEIKVLRDIIDYPDKKKLRQVILAYPKYVELKEFFKEHSVLIERNGVRFTFENFDPKAFEKPEPKPEVKTQTSKYSTEELAGMTTEQYLKILIADSDISPKIKAELASKTPWIKVIEQLTQEQNKKIIREKLTAGHRSVMNSTLRAHGIKTRGSNIATKAAEKAFVLGDISLEDYLALPIEKSDLSPAAIERLKERTSISTIHELVQAGAGKMYQVFGSNTLMIRSIKRTLSNHGLEFASQRGRKIEPKNIVPDLSKISSEDYLALPLENADFPPKYVSFLKERGGIQTVADLTACSMKELMQIMKGNYPAIKEIKTILASHGLKLTDLRVKPKKFGTPAASTEIVSETIEPTVTQTIQPEIKPIVNPNEIQRKTSKFDELKTKPATEFVEGSETFETIKDVAMDHFISLSFEFEESDDQAQKAEIYSRYERDLAAFEKLVADKRQELSNTLASDDISSSETKTIARSMRTRAGKTISKLHHKPFGFGYAGIKDVKPHYFGTRVMEESQSFSQFEN